MDMPVQAGQSQGNPSPAGASIEIDYARRDDTLKSLLVTRYAGAEILRNQTDNNGKTYSLVRFDGGVPIWEFYAGRNLVLSSLWNHASYRPTRIEYGKLPAGFSQDVPEGDPPVPLEVGQYYVFAVERTSGATSYQAVKVNAGGSLQVYNAEPRAGTSYRLCCNLPGDFAEPAANETPSPDTFP